jgi:hypothetical protein
MTVPEHQLDRSEGNGSSAGIDDKYDGTEYQSKDKRSDTKTTFYEHDIDSLEVSQRRKRQLKRSLRRNEGEDFGEGTTKDRNYRSRKKQNREEWRRRIVLTYASQAELTDRQKERCVHWMMDVLEMTSFGPYSKEKIALGVVNVVGNSEGRMLEDEELFQDLMRAAEITLDDDETPDHDTMGRLRGLVRDRIPSQKLDG